VIGNYELINTLKTIFNNEGYDNVLLCRSTRWADKQMVITMDRRTMVEDGSGYMYSVRITYARKSIDRNWVQAEMLKDCDNIIAILDKNWDINGKVVDMKSATYDFFKTEDLQFDIVDIYVEYLVYKEVNF